MLYCQIAQALQDVSQAPRRQKVDLTARFLADQGQEMLCPVVRLLLGELWQPWEEREMGIGPEALTAALAEVSEGDVDQLRERMGEMGMVAEAALQQKGQHSLCSEPLQAISVYERLRRVSRMKGKESEQRKDALLRGLFLQATPLEGKYIARTALRKMLAGIGHKTILAAFSQAFHGDQTRILRAYNIMPDPGRIANMTATSGLERSTVQPKTPLNLMIIRTGRAMNPEFIGENREIVFLPKYPGLRVQVHKIKGETLIFTTRLHNITATLNGLSQQLGAIEEDFIVDADLIGFQGGKVCRQSEMLKYINRRRLSRRSRLKPAILAYDLIYLSGEDTCSRPYSERRKRLVATLGEPRALPFSGISPAEEMLFGNNEAVKDRLSRTGRCGVEGLMVRDLLAAYTPGVLSRQDFIINSEVAIAAVIIRAEYGQGEIKPLYAKFRVALRSHGGLVPVGWVYRGLGQKEVLDLSRHLNELVIDQDEFGADVTPQVILNLLIRGAYECPDGYEIQQAVIQEIRLEASEEDADDLKELEEICGR
jgi:DNA ligase 1